MSKNAAFTITLIIGGVLTGFGLSEEIYSMGFSGLLVMGASIYGLHFLK